MSHLEIWRHKLSCQMQKFNPRMMEDEFSQGPWRGFVRERVRVAGDNRYWIAKVQLIKASSPLVSEQAKSCPVFSSRISFRHAFVHPSWHMQHKESICISSPSQVSWGDRYETFILLHKKKRPMLVLVKRNVQCKVDSCCGGYVLRTCTTEGHYCVAYLWIVVTSAINVSSTVYLVLLTA